MSSQTKSRVTAGIETMRSVLANLLACQRGKALITFCHLNSRAWITSGVYASILVAIAARLKEMLPSFFVICQIKASKFSAPWLSKDLPIKRQFVMRWVATPFNLQDIPNTGIIEAAQFFPSNQHLLRLFNKEHWSSRLKWEKEYWSCHLRLNLSLLSPQLLMPRVSWSLKAVIDEVVLVTREFGLHIQSLKPTSLIFLGHAVRTKSTPITCLLLCMTSVIWWFILLLWFLCPCLRCYL